VGSALLEHRLSMTEGPAYLESSNVRNVPLYQRFGFEVIQEISLPEDGPALWTMLRPYASVHEKIPVCGQLAPGVRSSEFPVRGHEISR
jgi:hypothetical protein